MKERLTRKFFTRPTLIVAKDLLGKILVRKIGKKIVSGKIVEVEAYIGPKDRASHAYLPRRLRKQAGGNKKTKRNEAEYLIGGHIYIYLVYGMHWQFNIVTGKEGSPECVLIRAIEPTVANEHKFITNLTNNISGIRAQIRENSRLATNGPGKLCRWLKFDKSFNREDLTKSKRVWLEDRGAKILRKQIVASKRIGIDYAGKYWANKKWRFYIRNSQFISKR